MNLRPIRERARNAAAVARLPLRAGPWAGAAGGILGRGTGSSIDFQDQRQYVPGDDPRHINWQAYARTGAYTMKLYREEVTPRIDLVYDVSGSMFLTPAKAVRSWELFYFCLESGLRLGGHVKLHILGRDTSDRPSEVPLARALADDWPVAFDGAVAEVRGGGGGPRRGAVVPQPALLADQLDRVPLRAGSLRVLVSDLLDESPPGRVAAAISAGRSRGVVLVPTAREESDPDWSANIEFEDSERGVRRRQRVDGDLLERYRQAYRRHFAIWREECLRRGIGLARVADGGSFLESLRGDAVPAGVIDMEAGG